MISICRALERIAKVSEVLTERHGKRITDMMLLDPRFRSWPVRIGSDHDEKT